MSNQLAGTASPYLLQHQHNPVDWYPWSDEALQRARELDRPIFLSIGYAACHWCHVMERESFENEQIAAFLNEHFVSIKVDREERPDLDQIYMNAVQMLTGSGGWPMNVFLTPDQKPFYGGTYWPPTQRMGHPGFDQVLVAVADAWHNRRDEVVVQAGELTKGVVRVSANSGSGGEVNLALLEKAAESLIAAVDRQWGGFGGAPKFPHCGDLELLLRTWHRTGDADTRAVVELTLDKMAAGGIYDHIGGGFSRYSVDARWLVPHFEKMLYDNSLLAGLYTRAFQALGRPHYQRVATQTLEYLQREMLDEAGGLHSSEDADSEGVEGKYYVWEIDEVIEVLGESRGRRFAAIYDIRPGGNFEGKSIPNLPRPIDSWAGDLETDPAELQDALDEDRHKLAAHRHKRVHPGRDDKILCSWNALAIDSFALASQVFQRDDFLTTAVKIADFIWSEMRRSDGRLLHAWRHGTAQFDAYLDDYAYLALSFVSLYEATGDERWISQGRELAATMIEQFADPEGGFFYTASDHEELIARTKDATDSSVPSGNAAAATALLRLAEYGDHGDYLEHASRTLAVHAEMMSQYPTACGHMLCAVDLLLGPRQQLVLAASDKQELRTCHHAFFARYRPRTSLAVLIGGPAKGGPLAEILRDREPVKGQLTAYQCENHTCAAPVTGESEVLAMLRPGPH